MVKHTAANHRDIENLKKSHEKMVQVADAINTAIKQGENRQKIIKIQESFVNSNLTVITFPSNALPKIIFYLFR